MSPTPPINVKAMPSSNPTRNSAVSRRNVMRVRCARAGDLRVPTRSVGARILPGCRAARRFLPCAAPRPRVRRTSRDAGRFLTLFRPSGGFRDLTVFSPAARHGLHRLLPQIFLDGPTELPNQLHTLAQLSVALEADAFVNGGTHRGLLLFGSPGPHGDDFHWWLKERIETGACFCSQKPAARTA